MTSSTRVIPQEAKDKALQALLGEQSAQAGGGCEDGHDHEGRQHQPDHHTGAERHCEWPPSLLPSTYQPIRSWFLVWSSSCVIGFFSLAAVCLEEAKRCAVQEVSVALSVGSWLMTVLGIVSIQGLTTLLILVKYLLILQHLFYRAVVFNVCLYCREIVPRPQAGNVF